MIFSRVVFLFLIAAFLLPPVGVEAYKFSGEKAKGDSRLPSDTKLSDLEGVGITQKAGAQLDLNLPFYNEKGEEIPLKSLFRDGKPIVLSPVYYSCPGLCNFHLNGLVDALRGLDWEVGKNFDVVAISFDSREKSDLATAKKKTYMKSYGRMQSESGWHFLTGEKEAVEKMTSQVGFGYRWNEKSKEWAHASAAIILTPDGKISRYLTGVHFEPKTVKLALTEASEGTIGNFIDQVILFCYQFDPKKNKYTLAAFNVMRIAGGLVAFLLAIWLVPYWARMRKEVSN